MDKNVALKEYGEIRIIDRRKISLNGVKRLISFNPKEFLIDSFLGVIVLKGEELELIKLDTMDGNLAIKGKINSLVYEEDKSKELSFISRLFK